jgi:hypothetical protein
VKKELNKHKLKLGWGGVGWGGGAYSINQLTVEIAFHTCWIRLIYLQSIKFQISFYTNKCNKIKMM